MAIFTNQAQLIYNGSVINSNVAVGEIVEALTAEKTPLLDTYTAGGGVSYVISLVNTGETALNNVTVTDDLGGYEYNGATIYPLTYTEGSAKAFVNGVLQQIEAQATETSLVISGLTVPANGSVVIAYEAVTNEYAPLGEGAQITNTATVTSQSITENVTASATVTAVSAADLSIAKSLDPVSVTENGGITYTITVTNNGNEAVEADGGAIIQDDLSPALSNLTATLNGTVLTETTDYTYDEATGEFATVAGVLTVPAATFTQNEDGSWTAEPGTSTLVLTGNI